jgi:hypothetical protein
MGMVVQEQTNAKMGRTGQGSIPSLKESKKYYIFFLENDTDSWMHWFSWFRPETGFKQASNIFRCEPFQSF